MASITVTFENRRLQLAAGAKITELTGRMSHAGGLPVGARVNHRLTPLDQELPDDAVVELITPLDPEGATIFRRSACLLLFEAVRLVAPGVRLFAGQSIGDWYYFELDGAEGPAPVLVDRIRETMVGLVREDVRFEVSRIYSSDAIRRFETAKRKDRVALLRTWWHESLRIVAVGGFEDILHGPVVPSAQYLQESFSRKGAEVPVCFELHPYEQGFVLGFAVLGRTRADLATPPPAMPKLYAVFQETKAWNRILGVSNVGEMNRACVSNDYSEVIRISEGFHEKKIAAIADRIGALRDRVRLVLIAGPSSSGKTTFTKRLGVQLRVIGLRPTALSTDDYYVDRARTPLGEDGRPDFEAIEAIDLDLFNDHLTRLLAGEETATPRYDFPTGKRTPPETWERKRLAKGDLLIVEGIHGLNDLLTRSIPAERKFRAYVSALTQLSIDDQNRIATSDARLLRRIVRDRLYRGHDTAATLRSWPSVRAGERKHIFPFQESADAMMNTALVYETSVLRVFAHRFLVEVPPEDPMFVEAYRLLKFLELFVPIFPDKVPQNSILREFIGGSTFHY